MLAQRFLSSARSCGLLLLLGLSASLIAFSPAMATLIIVPDQAPTIQVAIIAATNGDSILVRAGTYAESLTLSGKNVTIFGDPAAGATTISGLDSYRIMDVSGPAVTTATVFEDMTFRRGKAVLGAAIRMSEGASLTIRSCRFIQNLAEGDPCGAAGGAVFLDPLSTLLADSCLFQENRAVCLQLSGEGIGGAIEVSAGSRLEIRDSEFIRSHTSGFEGGFGGAINVSGTGLIERCRFAEGFGGEGGGIRVGIVFGKSPDQARNVRVPTYGLVLPALIPTRSEAEVVIRGCVFYRNEAVFAGDGIYCKHASVDIENNTFLESDSGIYAFYSQGSIANNTIAFNFGWGAGMEIQVAPQFSLSVQNNIVSHNAGTGITIYGNPPSGSIACNDVWGNQRGAYGGDSPDLTGIDGNIAQDPLYCNAQARDFTLNALSPCAPPHSPPGCELIGAWPVACGLAATGPETQPAALSFLTVIPNPVRGVARFEMDTATPPFHALHIFDLQGRMVEQILNRDGRWEWAPRTSVPAGVYFARPGPAPESSPAVKFLYLR